MTPGEIRQAIADAASTVDGIQVFAYYKPGKAGTGWVELLRTDYPNKFAGEDYWGVVVTLPGDDLPAAQKFMDDHRAALRAALMDELEVTNVHPEIVPLPDNPSMRTMVIEGHRATADADEE